jgi:hypothetical protein
VGTDLKQTQNPDGDKIGGFRKKVSHLLEWDSPPKILDNPRPARVAYVHKVLEPHGRLCYQFYAISEEGCRRAPGNCNIGNAQKSDTLAFFLTLPTRRV